MIFQNFYIYIQIICTLLSCDGQTNSVINLIKVTSVMFSFTVRPFCVKSSSILGDPKDMATIAEQFVRSQASTVATSSFIVRHTVRGIRAYLISKDIAWADTYKFQFGNIKYLLRIKCVLRGTVVPYIFFKTQPTEPIHEFQGMREVPKLTMDFISLRASDKA